MGIDYNNSNSLRTIANNNTQAAAVPMEEYRAFFVNQAMTYPSGYEGVVLSTTAPPPPPAKYVAMGDSFSSGEGSPSFESGTDEDSVNECHRSPSAYPRLLQSHLDLWPTAFVACSGATTFDVLGSEDDNPAGMWDEPSQISALSSDTQVVTITIGGNDIGFDNFAFNCLFPVDTVIGIEGSCDEYTDIYDDVKDDLNTLPSKLETVYSTILENAPNATIYVIGYPLMIPHKNYEDAYDQDCGGLYDPWPNNWGDARAANEITGILNSKIENAVGSVNTNESTSRLVFVPVDAGAFYGHDLCSSDSYFNGIFWPNNREYSIHPNSDGQTAYAEDVASAIS